MNRSSLFSESWHRIASRSAQLHPSVRVERQSYRGVPWYVLSEPFSNKFFRLSPAGYHFVARLRIERTIEEVWNECLEIYPDETPGQQEVVRLLAQLTQGNLIHSDFPPDVSAMSERRRKAEHKELRSKFLNFLFIKISLCDPTPFINALLPFFRPLLNRWGMILWSIVIFLGAKELFENWDAALDQTEGLLSPGNLFLLYLCGVIAKFWHELGHGLICRVLGGEVRTLGVMLLIFTPIPYVDATTSWGFRSKWNRIYVAAAGMIFEFFLAAIAVIIWANTSDTTMNAMAYNLMVIASITTFLFNINPLLRFDGYYILSDLIEIPNMSQRSNQQLKYLLEKFIFKCRHMLPAAQSNSESIWLAIYGISAGLYRIFLLTSIALIVADQFFGLGIVLAAITSFIWLAMPLYKFFYYLFTDPGLDATRNRALTIVFSILVGTITLLAIIPFPLHARAHGVVEADKFLRLFAPTSGRLEQVYTRPGTKVEAGDKLMVFSDLALDWKIEQAQAEIRASRATLQNLAFKENVRIKPVQLKLESARKNLKFYLEEKERLNITAPYDGVWAAPELDQQIGAWFHKGTPIGVFLKPTSYRFVAIVEQPQAADVFFQSIRGASVRLIGQAGKEIEVLNMIRIPGEQKALPSPALGWGGGGEIEVSQEDPQGVTSKEPFFMIYAELENQENVYFVQHRRGQIRFHIGYEPLLKQGWRLIRQVLQDRLKL
ncbi:MAG: biotin/lipoyl-binding protein [Verrucomicrobiota bacterium]